MSKSIKISIKKVEGAYSAFKGLYGVSSLDATGVANYSICVYKDVIYYAIDSQWKKLITVKPDIGKFFINEVENFMNVFSNIAAKYSDMSSTVLGSLAISSDEIMIYVNDTWSTVLTYSIGEVEPSPEPEPEPAPKDDYVKKSEINQIIQNFVDKSNLAMIDGTTLDQLNMRVLNVIYNINQLFSIS